MLENKPDPIKFMEGKKIYLRPYEPEDSELLYRSTYNPEAMRFTGTQKLFSRSAIELYLGRIADDDSRVDMIIARQDNDQAVGEVVLNSIDRINRSANIRIWLFSPEDYNMGYGSEAMLLMMRHGFGRLNLHRIELGVFAFNDRAAHVYEKLGFRKEGVVRDYLYYDNAYHDQIIMGILEDEFRTLYLQENPKF
ncbi:MAG TPA: GNAT family protein [Chloroflexia bacterium]|nr:GNAT family protein [Chloroflexia bacterium]